MHDAKSNKSKSIELWGSGEPYREFLFVDDLVDACLFLMNIYNQNEIINIGTGVDLKIKDLATLMMKTIGYECDLLLNSEMPDGTPRKLLDVSKINRLGWHSTTDLELGIKLTYQDFVENYQIYSKI